MPNWFPHVPYERLVTMAKMSGGLATLVLAALFISGTPSNSHLAAAVVCSGGTTCTTSSTNLSLTLAGTGLVNNGDGSIDAPNGQTFTLTWPTPTGGARDASTFNCFGDGVTCGSFVQSVSAGYARILTSFSDGTNTYVVAATGIDNLVRIFRWLPGSPCIGNATTCGVSLQDIRATYPLTGYPFTVGSETFLAVSNQIANTSTATNPSYIYKWIPAQYAEGSQPVSATPAFAGYTMVDRSWQVDNNSTVTKIGNYSSSAATITVKILKRNSATNYDVVVSQSCSHPGGGWYDCTLTTPYVVPATGTYHAGAYNASNMGATNATVARAYLAGNTTGTGKIFTEDTNTTDVIRVVYQTAVSNTPCFGDGVECAVSNEVVLGENSIQDIGATYSSSHMPWWAKLAIGTTTYLVMGNYYPSANDSRMYTFKWMPAGSPATSTNPVGCFGNGSACANSTLGSNAYQSVGAEFVHGPTIFSSGGADYLIAPALFENNPMYVFKWTSSGANCPTGGGWGNGTACATTSFGVNTYQQILEDNHKSIELFTINNDLYLIAGAYSTTSSPIYKWIPSGTNCPNGGASPGWGSDNSGSNVCATVSGGGMFQAVGVDTTGFYPPDGETYGALMWTAIKNGADTYLFEGISGYVYKWILNGGSMGKGCLGDGGTCANKINGSNTFSILGGTESAYGGWNVLDLTSNGSLFILTQNKTAPQSFFLMKPVPVPCFGNGTTCGTTAQALSLTQPAIVKNFTMSGTQYLAVGSAGTGNTYSALYRWSTTGACWGNISDTCGSAVQNFPAGNTVAISAFSASGNQYLATANHDTSQIHLYKWISASNCFGDGTTCGVQYQKFTMSNADDFKVFTIPGDATAAYAVAAGDGSGAPYYKWTTGGACPVSGGFGNGTNCNSISNVYSIGQLGGSVNTTSVEPFTIGAAEYVTISYTNGTSNKTSVYKWIPGSACFGDGTTCDQTGGAHPYQTTTASSNNSDAADLLVFDNNSTTTLAYVNDENNSTKILKWNTAGASCTGGYWGNGTSTCSTTDFLTRYLQQLFAVGGGQPEYARSLTIGSSLYLLVGMSNDQYGSYIFKWIPSRDCYGDGINCGARLQGLPVGGDGQKGDAVTTSDGSYFLIPNTNSNVVNAYKYTSGGGVTPGCTLYQKPSSSSIFSPIATGDSNLTGVFVTPTSDTTYQLTCTLADGSIESTPILLHLVTSNTPTVTVAATDSTATEVAGNTGTFTITRTAVPAIPVTPVIVFLTSTTSSTWTVPSDWNSASNTVEVIGGGGAGGNGGSSTSGSGGGGAAYSKSVNIALTPGASVTYAIGSAGFQVGGPCCIAQQGGDSWFNATSFAACTTNTTCVSAKGGAAGSTLTGGTGGAAASGVGTVKYSGGTAVNKTSSGGSGGGGAGGPHGNGNPSTVQNGGTGDAGFGGAGGIVANPPNPGSPGTEYDSTHGSGGGGASPTGLAVATGGLGGSYGAGGGGGGGSSVSQGGKGSSGLIVITYTPTTGGTSAYPPLTVDFALSGVATNSADYQTITSPLQFADGEISKTITVTPSQDSVYEGPETVILTIEADVSYAVGSPESATVTITDAQTSSSLPAAAFDSCTTAGGTCELGVSPPTRVRKGSAVTISWSVAGLVTGANGNSGDTCTLTGSPSITATGFPPAFAIDASNNWAGSVANILINQATIITLQCVAPDGTTSKSTSRTIQLLPTYQEI